MQTPSVLLCLLYEGSLPKAAPAQTSHGPCFSTEGYIGLEVALRFGVCCHFAAGTSEEMVKLLRVEFAEEKVIEHQSLLLQEACRPA